ncbi:hypothetical protein FNV58_01265 (plasmid) [Streptomyces sp. RLB1-9]|uniref:hypothetical protein n=1 Tax=Streptomyces sp. RLB1-9 TaxID=2594454 RepID=UPI001162D904|nr:hypothetical protein [Streptomyces sp. RLB1-9]QDN94991.1 hypothetical protein FNV58_01265 [Streptomyces sp. RLB1-9]
MAKTIDKVCSRCGVVHFSVEAEADGDLVHFQLVVTKWPCTESVVRERPRLADMLATALVSEAAA